MAKRIGHTRLYSNDHDNRIYFQDLTEILEEMNGLDFNGSMGYAELCVETTLKNYYDIDIMHGPLVYDPDVDYRVLLIDLDFELEQGYKNAVNVGYEDIAAYYASLQQRIANKENKHIREHNFSNSWKPLFSEETVKKWIFGNQ